MAATTLANFYAALRDLSMLGVTNLDEPPMKLDTADQYKWVDSVGVDEAQLRVSAVGGDRLFRARVVVVTNSVGQGTHAQRWTDAVAMADTLNTALKTLTDYPRMEYSIDVSPGIGEGRWMGVVADITLQESKV